eukprot:gene16458-biopygen10154
MAILIPASSSANNISACAMHGTVGRSDAAFLASAKAPVPQPYSCTVPSAEVARSRPRDTGVPPRPPWVRTARAHLTRQAEILLAELEAGM